MAKFTFQLESVLRHRRMVEEQRQRELAMVLKERAELREQLRQMQQTISRSKRQLCDGLIGAVDVDRVAGFARYSAQVTQRARGYVLKLASVEKRIEEARGRLLEAKRARRALELLRERRYAQWKLEQERREAAALDELAVQRHARRESSGAQAEVGR